MFSESICSQNLLSIIVIAPWQSLSANSNTWIMLWLVSVVFSLKPGLYSLVLCILSNFELYHRRYLMLWRLQLLLQHSENVDVLFSQADGLRWIQIAKLCPLESSSTLSSAPLSLWLCCFEAALCQCGSGSDRILVRVYTQNLGLFLSLDHFFPMRPLPRLHFSTLCSLVLRPEGLWIFLFFTRV